MVFRTAFIAYSRDQSQEQYVSVKYRAEIARSDKSELEIAPNMKTLQPLAFSNVTLVKLAQFAKALRPMLVTESGIVTSAIFSQY